MLRIGEYNKMKVDREKDFGFYLRELDGRAEVLLPKSLLEVDKWSATLRIFRGITWNNSMSFLLNSSTDMEE